MFTTALVLASALSQIKNVEQQVEALVRPDPDAPREIYTDQNPPDPDEWDRALARQDALRTSRDPIDQFLSTLTKSAIQPEAPLYLSNRPGEAVKLKETENPAPHSSFGFAGPAILIEADSGFLDGLLAIPLDDAATRQFERESLSVFRWSESDRRFERVGSNRVSDDDRLLVGRVDRPGIHVVVGLTRDPLRLALMRGLGGLSAAFATLPVDQAESIRDQLCGRIYCVDEIMHSMVDSIGVHHPPTGGVGGICKLCTELPVGIGRWVPLPEMELDRPEPVFATWECAGPYNLSGCVRQVVVDPTNASRIYAASEHGGIWVLDDVNDYPRTAWRPLTDEIDFLQMRAFAVAPGDGRVLYAANSLGSLYRSVNRGLAWSRLDSPPGGFGYVRKIAVHPHDADTIFVAGNNGLFTRSGTSGPWTVLRSDDVLDLAVDPADTSILYVGVRRVGVLKSVNFGLSWSVILPWPPLLTPLSELIGASILVPLGEMNRTSLPEPLSEMIRISLGVRTADGSLQTPSTRTVVVKFGRDVHVHDAAGNDLTTWRSSRPPYTYNRAGEPFIDSGGSRRRSGYADQGGEWCNALSVSPFDSRVVLAGQQLLRRTVSSDQFGIVSDADLWAVCDTVHEDCQSIAHSPCETNVVFLANDGGVFRSSDGGRTFVDLNIGLVTSEPFRAAVEHDVAIANFDHYGVHGSTALSTGVWQRVSPSPKNRYGNNGLEFSFVHCDPKNAGRFFAASHSKDRALLRMIHPNNDEADSVIAFSDFASGYFPTDPRRDLHLPIGSIAVDPRTDSAVILAVARDGTLRMTLDGDADPTFDPPIALGARDNPDVHAIVGVPVWTEVALPGRTAPVSSIAFAPSDPGVALAIAENGRVFRSDDVADSTSWTSPGTWSSSAVRQVLVNTADSNRVYAIADRSFGRSEDGGATWVSTPEQGLPATSITSIATHPRSPHVLYLSADDGVYISHDEGDSWSFIGAQLPNAITMHVFTTREHLYAVLHGRGLWRLPLDT